MGHPVPTAQAGRGNSPDQIQPNRGPPDRANNSTHACQTAHFHGLQQRWTRSVDIQRPNWFSCDKEVNQSRKMGGNWNERFAVTHRTTIHTKGASIKDVRKTTTVEPAYMVHGYKIVLHIWSILGWPQSVLAILTYNLLIRSGRLYGQFFLDKTWTLQAGSTVFKFK